MHSSISFDFKICFRFKISPAWTNQIQSFSMLCLYYSYQNHFIELFRGIESTSQWQHMNLASNHDKKTREAKCNCKCVACTPLAIKINCLSFSISSISIKSKASILLTLHYFTLFVQFYEATRRESATFQQLLSCLNGCMRIISETWFFHHHHLCSLQIPMFLWIISGASNNESALFRCTFWNLSLTHNVYVYFSRWRYQNHKIEALEHANEASKTMKHILCGEHFAIRSLHHQIGHGFFITRRKWGKKKTMKIV